MTPEKIRLRAIISGRTGVVVAIASILAGIPWGGGLTRGAEPHPGAGALQDERAVVKSPLSPVDSLPHFRLDSGLRIELAAAEPEVVDPVDLRFDEHGRMWVVEMRDYPNGPAEGEPPQSRIVILEDRDFDGRYEHSRVFADGLLFATGLQPWRGGVIVTLAGKVAYFPDDDHDGRAEAPETWFTGFAEENPQLRANHPRLGHDGWIYVSNGLRGGVVRDERHPDREPISIAGRNFRFRPDGSACEATSGHGQFGLTFDEFGERFECSNRNPLIHVVLADRYLRGNPLQVVGAVTWDVAAAGEASRVFPLTAAWTTSNLHAGQFTAACGLEIYRGSALPGEYRGNAFICEPTGGLVHREILKPLGATFRSYPANDEREFLASDDPWFRPVHLETGPDGALYVVDMYRAVIEHPEWVPDELKHRVDERFGDDRGRIYRVTAAPPAKNPTSFQGLGETSEEWIANLGADSAWRRETAARLLWENLGQFETATLTVIARECPIPAAKTRALWLLAEAGALTEENLLEALADANARVREQAILLAEPRLSESRAMQDAMGRLVDDPDPRLRFQLALTLAGWGGEPAIDRLVRLAAQGADDEWTRRAVATLRPELTPRLFVELLAAEAPREFEREGLSSLLAELAGIVGATGEPVGIDKALGLLAKLTSEGVETPALVAYERLLRGVARHGASLETLAREGDGARDRDRAMIHFEQLARRRVTDSSALSPLRLAALDILAYSRDAESLATLGGFLEGPVDPALRSRAISTLARRGDRGVGEMLLAKLAGQTPSVRGAILDAMLANETRVALLLDEVEAGRLKPNDIDVARADRLIRHANLDLRDRAAKLWAAGLPGDRGRVLEEYRPCLERAADALRGLEVFKKNCVNCHRVRGLGVDVGPSISDSRDKTPERLLTDILQPSRAIDANFVSYSLITTDGQALVGVIVTETATSITLKQAEAKTVTILRADIDELRSNGVSLMPDGLERQIGPQEMADLISFLKNWRYLEGEIPGLAP